MIQTLVSLGLIFSQLSVLAFGGGATILPEMQRQVVEVHHWMSGEEFNALFALSQAAPGPNLMIVTLVGWHVAGPWGMLVTTLAKFGPSSAITIMTLHVWDRFKDKPWRSAVQAGLLPVTAGLIAAGAGLIAHAADGNWLLIAITAAVAVIGWRSQVHPLWLLFGGSAAGLLLLGRI
jgi:chromate transporter